MDVPRLETEAQYDVALARLLELAALVPVPESHEARELSQLIKIVHDYECRTVTFPKPDPIDAIEFRLDQLGLTVEALIPMIGSGSEVAAVLERRRPLTVEMIRRLRDGLDIPADTLLREYVVEDKKVA